MVTKGMVTKGMVTKGMVTGGMVTKGPYLASETQHDLLEQERDSLYMVHGAYYFKGRGSRSHV